MNDLDECYKQTLDLIGAVILEQRLSMDMFEEDLVVNREHGIDNCDKSSEFDWTSELTLSQLLSHALADAYLLLNTLHCLKKHRDQLNLLEEAQVRYQYKELCNRLELHRSKLTTLKLARKQQAERVKSKLATETKPKKDDNLSQWLKDTIERHRKPSE